jgi:hypothetical protein
MNNKVKIIERGEFRELSIDARRAILKNIVNDFKIYEYQALSLCVRLNPIFRIWNDSKSAFCSMNEFNNFYFESLDITTNNIK